MTDQRDFENIIRRVLKQWFVILSLSIIFAMLAGIATSRMYRPAYATESLIAVYSKEGYGTVVEDAEETSQMFQEILNSNLLQKRVAEEMGISALPGTITCSNIPETNMILLRVTASTPENVMVTMNGFLDHYEVVTEQLLDNMVMQILEQPKVPMGATKVYDEWKVLSTTFLTSTVLICAGLFLYFYFRDDIKNEQQIEKKLDTKLFATIYHEDINKGFRFPVRKRKNTGILVTNPVTSFGYIETFKKMCMRLEHQTKARGYKCIVMTSVRENEGKSTVSANLALSLAEIGKNVLLVDLDLRKPAQFKLFEIPYVKEDVQVGDVLSGYETAENAIRVLGHKNLSVLAGNRSYRNSARILIRESATQAMEELKKSVDYIIIDTPPLSLVSDAEEIMRFADAGLLVVRQNTAKTKDINDTIDVFKNADCKLLGCVFNDVKMGVLGATWLQDGNYNSRYGYGYGKAYGNYNKKAEAGEKAE